MSDARNHRLQVFDDVGKHLYNIGPDLGGDVRMNQPSS